MEHRGDNAGKTWGRRQSTAVRQLPVRQGGGWHGGRRGFGGVCVCGGAPSRQHGSKHLCTFAVTASQARSLTAPVHAGNMQHRAVVPYNPQQCNTQLPGLPTPPALAAHRPGTHRRHPLPRPPAPPPPRSSRPAGCRRQVCRERSRVGTTGGQAAEQGEDERWAGSRGR